MSESFEDRVVLVTGGSMGIGRSACELFAARGARVLIADREEEKGRALAEAIEKRGGAARFFKVDVSRSEEVAAMVADAVEHFGALDFAINNAGVGGVSTITADYPEDTWRRVIDVNLTGLWLCMKHELPHLLGRGGAIVNLASIAGLAGFRKHSAYAASKYGVIGLTKTAALEYAKKGVRINAVCPGYTQTAMVDELRENNPRLGASLEKYIPMGRLGTTREIAETILFLCTPGAGFITGQIITADGGITAG